MQDFIEGDLMEVYHKKLAKSTKRKADIQFIIGVLLLFRPGIIRQPRRIQNFNHPDMFKNYFKTGWRNLLRSKLHSTLNITGLTLGIVCFLLIGLYVFDELTFDQQHGKAERIYRVIEHETYHGTAETVAAGSYKLADESKNVIPEVENTTMMQRPGRANLIDPKNPVPFQETVTIADEHFFEIFDFPLIYGDSRTALKEPNSIVINEDLAMRLFNTTDVMGRDLQYSHLRSTTFKITGVLKNLPPNSSFNFNNLHSISTYHSMEFFKETQKYDWSSNDFSVYALLRSNANADSVAAKMTRLVLSNVTLDPGDALSFSLQPFLDIHLKSGGIADGARNGNVEGIPQGNPLYITIFTFAAIFVLLISGINYTNLTTARAASRMKEIGVRKSVGAERGNLVGQFLFESWLTTFIAFAIAVILTNLVLPIFNNFANKNLSLGLSVDFRFVIIAVLSVVFIGLLSGSYAALLLSRLKPVALLKGLKLKAKGDLSVRKFLVVFQFAISIFMIIGTIVLLMQVRFLNNSDLGFNKDLMVIIDVNTGAARANFETVKNEMSKIPAVKSVSCTSRVPGEWKTISMVKVKSEGNTGDPYISYLIGADQDFMKTFEISLLQGRNFDSPSDSANVILNETAAKLFNITEASGQILEMPQRTRGGANTFGPVFNDHPDLPFRARVIGIVKDFHFQSLHARIEPLILAYNNNPIHVIDYYSVRIDPTDIQETLDKLKAVMVRADADDPFEYHFLDDQLALFYIEDQRRQTLLAWTATATIFIACLGLFGLATYSIEQRVKEIGIRKVLGATVVSVVALLSSDFIKLVLIANVIAIPAAWWAGNLWLQEYAYHIDLGWWIFVAAGVAATLIAFLTVSYQAFRSAITNPVNSLRSE